MAVAAPFALAMNNPARTAAAARPKLWELDVACHGPLVGSCWTAAELRRLTDRLFGGRSSLDDFGLHAAVLTQCATRNKLSLGLQRVLDQRAAEPLRRLAAAPGMPACEALWREALHGGDVGSALWALWTSPHCNDTLHERIHQDLYLLQQHRVATLRADAAERAGCRAEQQALQVEMRRTQERQARWRSEALAERDALKSQLAQLRQRVLAQQSQWARLRQEAASHAPAAGREKLLQRIAELSCELALARQAAAPDTPPPRQDADAAPPAAQAAVETTAEPAAALASASVLCVGGRSGHVPLYRALVERRGGLFVHHDGGLEDNPHRLEAQLAAADLVVCHAGCLNHNAYARVKAHIKRSGKPCVFVDKPGAGSFARALAQGAAFRQL
jgi:hypothetical protein